MCFACDWEFLFRSLKSINMTRNFNDSLNFIIFAFISFLLTLNCSGLGDTGQVTEITNKPEISLVLAASEILVGKNRFPFGMLSEKGSFLRDSPVEVEFFSLEPEFLSQSGLKTKAYFQEIKGSTPHRHVDGEIHMHEEVVGIHVVDQVEFNEAGTWVAKIYAEGETDFGLFPKELYFQVIKTSSTLMVGDSAPPSRNPVITSSVAFEEITTHHPPIPEFYQLTIEDALKEKKPLVVVFSTPGFCVSRMCGPVTDVVAEVLSNHIESTNFIHVEPWDLESARRGGPLIWSKVASEWKLPSEPWVFVIDTEGKIFARFEGTVSVDELEKALANLLS